jgi:hypothetical protein
MSCYRPSRGNIGARIFTGVRRMNVVTGMCSVDPPCAGSTQLAKCALGLTRS